MPIYGTANIKPMRLMACAMPIYGTANIKPMRLMACAMPVLTLIDPSKRASAVWSHTCRGVDGRDKLQTHMCHGHRAPESAPS
jgi:hypothetical protein